MLRFLKKALFVATFAVMVAGCSQLPTPTLVIKPSKAEQALIAANAEHEKNIKDLNAKIAELSKNFQTSFDANISLGSASVLSVYDTMLADPDKDKFDLAEMKGLEVAIKALPEPTLADYRKTTETQRKLLSDQAKEIEQGKAEIEAQKKIADDNKAAQKKALEEKAAIEAAKAASEEAFSKEKDKLQEDIKNEKNAKIAEQSKNLEDEKAKKELQMLVVKILMGVGIVAGIAAFFLKSPTAGIAAAACIALAISVSFLPTWALICGLVCVFGLLLFPFIHGYIQKKKALEHVVGATQDYKNDHPDEFKAGIANNLNEWNKEHADVAKTIDKTLKDIRLK